MQLRWTEMIKMTLLRKTTMTMAATMEAMTMPTTVLMMLVLGSELGKQREVEEMMMVTTVTWTLIYWQRVNPNQRVRVTEPKVEMLEAQRLLRAFKQEPLLEAMLCSLMTNQRSQAIPRTRRATQVKRTSRRPRISPSPRSNLSVGRQQLQRRQQQREQTLPRRQCSGQ